MAKKQKKMLIRIVIAAVLVVAFSLIPMKGYGKDSKSVAGSALAQTKPSGKRK